MELKSNRLSEKQGREISKWRYEGEYAIYNLPSWEKMLEENYSITDSIKRERYIAYTDNNDNLVGFVNLLDEGENVFFGIGINPKYCGKGIGKEITKLALNESKRRFGNKPVVLEVRTWNERAVKCYKSQGFQIVEVKKQETCLGFGEFYVMECR